MSRLYTGIVELHCTCIPNNETAFYLVSRRARGSWFSTEAQEFETLLFTSSGVHPVHADGSGLGPALELWQRNPERQPYHLSFPQSLSNLGLSAAWDPWSYRVLFTYGGSEVLCLDGETNEVTVLVDFAESTGTAPLTCDYLVVDPQQQGRIWVVTAFDCHTGCGGAVYELNLLASAPSCLPATQPSSTHHVSLRDQNLPPPGHVTRRVAEFSEPLKAAAFDATRRYLLVATEFEIYGFPVDLRSSAAETEPELLIGSGGGGTFQADGDAGVATLNGIVGLACGGSDDCCYVIEEAQVLSFRRRGVTTRGSIRKLQLEPLKKPSRSTPAPSALHRRANTGGGGATLTTLVTASGVSWRSPCVLSNGCLALLNSDDIVLVSLGLQWPTLPQQLLGVPVGGGGGSSSRDLSVAKPIRRTLGTDLGALLDSCQVSGGGGGGDVTLIAAGGVELRAHCTILSARCDYFATLLGADRGFSDSGTRRIHMCEVDPDVLRCVLRYIYTGVIEDLDEDLDLDLNLDPDPKPGRVGCRLGNGKDPGEAHRRGPQTQRSGQPAQVDPQQQQQQTAGLEERSDDGSDGHQDIGDPLHVLAAVSDRLLLSELSHAAQGQVLRRTAAAPAKHLVADLLWAERHGFTRLVAELKELYLQHEETLARLERAHEPRRLAHGHSHGYGHSLRSGGRRCSGGGPRLLAASNPELAAELEVAAAARKRRRVA